MGQHFNKGGRPPKINPATFRYVVRFNAVENGVSLTKYEKSGVVNKSAFIKDVLLGKSFKVFVVDQNTREFIDMLSSLNARYRTFVIDYDLTVKTLRENFTENKALKAIYKLEVKLNREIAGAINLAAGAATTSAFAKCRSLRIVWIRNLASDISFADSPDLRQDCIDYMVENAANTAAITITLHAEAFGRLTPELIAKAAERQITFASA